MIPVSSQQAFRDALVQFDKELRQSREWLGWEENRVHKFAIDRGGKLYPVKQIVSMATGLPASEFSGGGGSGQANAYASTQWDAKVVPLRSRTSRNPDWDRDELVLALDLYLRHRASPPGKTSREIADLSETLNQLAAALGHHRKAK